MMDFGEGEERREGRRRRMKRGEDRGVEGGGEGGRIGYHVTSQEARYPKPGDGRLRGPATSALLSMI